MNTQFVNLSCEIELKTGEKLYLPDEIVNGVGAGRWMISIVPIPNTDQAIRQHDAFLNGYAPEDEGLYDELSVLN